MMDEYLTIRSQAKSIYKDRNSKFIGLLYPIENLDEVKNYLQIAKKEYYDATHHCYAYILGVEKEIQFDSDAGEPSGSAGKPILNALLSADITNILAVVVRYFGGTKLGISGLINAYKSATLLAIENSEIITKYIYDIFNVSIPYTQQQLFFNLQKKYEFEFEIINADNIGQDIQIKIRKSKRDLLIKDCDNIGFIISE
ncbi:MAG: YigZ family protein [Bacteroidales bacterium]|jgi:uncharacterized YigZ family protein|nr:YigZ family protein [Bacteroidales bacterium]MDD2593196.1 YigZ family protein [Bacteroidales bacterium]MDI9576192.1 YigZ family protein [Bacteroidota bacterium]MDY0401349.1 YigZ family protein [Bacteroidales bacterium]HOB78027.1 YigZ family protein [Bacteroidales bacterium]